MVVDRDDVRKEDEGNNGAPAAPTAPAVVGDANNSSSVAEHAHISNDDAAATARIVDVVSCFKPPTSSSRHLPLTLTSGPPTSAVAHKKNRVMPLPSIDAISAVQSNEQLQSPHASLLPPLQIHTTTTTSATKVAPIDPSIPTKKRRGSSLMKLNALPVTLTTARASTVGPAELLHAEIGSVEHALPSSSASAKRPPLLSRTGAGSKTGSTQRSVAVSSARSSPTRVHQTRAATECVVAEDAGNHTWLQSRWRRFYHQHERWLVRFAVPIIDPRANAKLAWDSLIMCIVLYSAIVVPIEVGFPDVAFSAGWRAASIAMDVLFSLDVVQHFVVGYYVSDDEPMVCDRWPIARRYLTTWFIPDVLAILPADYVINNSPPTSTISDNDSSSHHSVLSLKLARLIRLVRVTKLARLIKLRQFAMKIEDVLELDAVLTRMTRLICQVLLVAHVLACFWHFIGFTNSDETTTWIAAAGLADASASVRYLYSLYWVIATVAGVGYGDIHATNTYERLFSMATMVIGASGFGVIIANITTILSNWNRETATRARKLSIVQAFVATKAIPKPLASRLLRYFRHYIAKTSAFDERELLGEFSLSLRGEVLRETYKSSFFRIPAFERLSPQFVLDMAMCIKPLIAVPGDVLAREHSVGTEMFILNSGVIEVQRTASATTTKNKSQTTDAVADASDTTTWLVVLEVLTQPGVFGTSSLLNYTLHQNSYIARASCELFTLPKEDFDRLIDEFPDVEQTMLTYHEARSALYDRVFQQTLARYRVFEHSQEQPSDAVADTAGVENLYPTLSVLLDGVLTSYRSVPLPILQVMTLDLSMGVSVFNSVAEKHRMIADVVANTPAQSTLTKWRLCVQQPIGPDNSYKLAWDVFIGAQLLYCAVAIPFEITFGSIDVAAATPDSFTPRSSSSSDARLAALETAIEVAFAIDIILNFRTAVVDRRTHRLITSARGIAHRYVRSWLLIDVLAVLPVAMLLQHWSRDTLDAGGGSTTTTATNKRSVFYFRAIRLLKLTRVLKLLRTAMRVDTIAVASHLTLRVVRLIVKVCFIAHILTCGFYYVSSTSADVYGTSLMHAMPVTHTLSERYVYCLYWAVTTMTTVGYGDTHAGNPIEVLYITVGVVIGASTFTYVVGTLSSLVDELHATHNTHRARMDHLNAYVKERGLPKPLAARLRRYYAYYLRQRDDAHDDAILASLSDNLRAQLVLHLNRDVVRKIAFFATQDDACVSYLMGCILAPEFCTPGEYVFKEGQVGRHMYFLVHGVADVLFHAGTGLEVVVATLNEGSYFGEIAMLTMSKRAASIRAKTFLSLFVLSRSGLDRISLHYPEMATNILHAFRQKITHIKQTTSVRDLAPLVTEDVRAARVRSGLVGSSSAAAAHTSTSNSSSYTNGSANGSELATTLQELERVVSRIVAVYGGGDKGKRKALACVMTHLRKFEFSLDDVLLAAEDLTLAAQPPTPTQQTSRTHLTKAAASIMMLNRLQFTPRRRPSFT